MLSRFLYRTDPFEGIAARRTRLRKRIESILAFILASVACGIVIAAWVQLGLDALGATVSR